MEDSIDFEQHQYYPYRIYENLKKLLEYRKLELVSGAHYIETKKVKKTVNQFLEHDEFVQNIQYYGYVLIEAKDKPDKNRRFHKSVPIINRSRPVKTYIALLDLNSMYVQSTQKFVTLLSRIPGFDDATRDSNIDIIIISRDDLGLHIMKKVEASISEGDSDNGFIHIQACRYYHFSSERPKHKLVAPQKICPRDSEKAILNSFLSDKRDLPKIKKSDPIGIWLGVEIGDIVEAQFSSEASGIETKYLTVRP